MGQTFINTSVKLSFHQNKSEPTSLPFQLVSMIERIITRKLLVLSFTSTFQKATFVKNQEQ
jgi:hypothetical protein